VKDLIKHGYSHIRSKAWNREDGSIWSGHVADDLYLQGNLKVILLAENDGLTMKDKKPKDEVVLLGSRPQTSRQESY